MSEGCASRDSNQLPSAPQPKRQELTEPDGSAWTSGEILVCFVLVVLLIGVTTIAGVLIYRNEGIFKRGRRMASTPRPPTPIERIARLEADNRQLRDLLYALHRKIDVFQHVIDNLQRAAVAPEPAEFREPSQSPPQPAIPHQPADGDRDSGGLVWAYNGSLHTQPGVRAFLQAQPVFGLGKSNARAFLRHIDGDLQQCDFWGMRDERRGDVLCRAASTT
jgi:hypothetical protein